jgi:hypothetical protein
MTRQFKIVQCPHCQEYTYFPADNRNPKCPRCNIPLALAALESSYAASAAEAPQAVQARQYELYRLQPPPAMTKPCSPTSEVIRLLRRREGDQPQWVAVVEVVRHCMKLGLSSQRVQAAIAALADQGFLELREGSVRAISIN